MNASVRRMRFAGVSRLACAMLAARVFPRRGFAPPCKDAELRGHGI